MWWIAAKFCDKSLRVLWILDVVFCYSIWMPLETPLFRIHSLRSYVRIHVHVNLWFLCGVDLGYLGEKSSYFLGFRPNALVQTSRSSNTGNSRAIPNPKRKEWTFSHHCTLHVYIQIALGFGRPSGLQSWYNHDIPMHAPWLIIRNRWSCRYTSLKNISISYYKINLQEIWPKLDHVNLAPPH